MKANELMIGDWVMYNPNQFNDDAYEYSKDSYPKQIQSGEEIDLAIEDCYTPIQLTEEILKANAKYTSKEILYTTYLLFHKEINYQIQGYVEVWFDNEDTFFFHANIILGYNIDGKVSYVHELQHALRLCGLTELADNFKIK